MATRDERPTTASPAGTARPRRRAVVVAVALSVVLALLATWWAAPALVDLGRDAVPSFGDGTVAVELPQFGEGGSYVLAYDDGGYAEVRIPVRNDGRLPVSLRGVRLTDQSRSLAEVVAAAAPGGAPLPLDLGPGQEAMLSLTLRFDNCDYYHERAMQALPAALVDVSVLGRAGVVEVPLARPLLVRSPMIVDCPDRVLDRQAKTRRGS